MGGEKEGRRKRKTRGERGASATPETEHDVNRGVITPVFSVVGIGVGFMADWGGIGIAGVGSKVELVPLLEFAPLVELVSQLEPIHCECLIRSLHPPIDNNRHIP